MTVVDCQTRAGFTSRHPFDPPRPTISRSHNMPLTPWNRTLITSSQAPLGIKSLMKLPPVRPINRSYEACPSSQNTASRPCPE
ncbi:hypothetical protein OIDMADRAFT_16346 [Oidiodendron maius Zn]|uniref:Uncharacterized protein n=1 Tax=Oidiodendron maius (strain Zn) TaxID=913774 RepID=A0A0C3HY65_OIDMZ|nr:hypothetical protein OIDMADRAFT_16346 [Oidiodendron maius Zn]